MTDGRRKKDTRCRNRLISHNQSRLPVRSVEFFFVLLASYLIEQSTWCRFSQRVWATSAFRSNKVSFQWSLQADLSDSFFSVLLRHTLILWLVLWLCFLLNNLVYGRKRHHWWILSDECAAYSVQSFINDCRRLVRHFFFYWKYYLPVIKIRHFVQCTRAQPICTEQTGLWVNFVEATFIWNYSLLL